MFGRRVKREGGARIPVIAFTGFLGAGKTTLIREFLAQPAGANTAVIVNEFGEIGIDQVLLRSSNDNVVLLGNGCVCCRMLNDLQETLRAMMVDRARGVIPSFERIVIETTGLADPVPLLQTFISDRVLGGDFHLYALICVVDAATLAASLAEHPEATKQIILADRVVLSKAELALPEAVERAVANVRELNPVAPVRQAHQGRIDPDFLTEKGTDRRPLLLFAEQVRHRNDIVTFPVIFDEPLDWAAFARAMEMLAAMRGSNLLRVKGLISVRGCSGPVLVQFVQHLAHAPVELEEWPDADHRSRLVFITRNIEPEGVIGLLRAMQRLALPRQS